MLRDRDLLLFWPQRGSREEDPQVPPACAWPCALVAEVEWKVFSHWIGTDHSDLPDVAAGPEGHPAGGH